MASLWAAEIGIDQTCLTREIRRLNGWSQRHGSVHTLFPAYRRWDCAQMVRRQDCEAGVRSPRAPSSAAESRPGHWNATTNLSLLTSDAHRPEHSRESRKHRCGADHHRSPAAESVAPAISNDHHRRSGGQIVVACHGKTVGASHRHSQQVTWRRTPAMTHHR